MPLRAERSSLGLHVGLLLLLGLPVQARAQECYTQFYALNQKYLESTVDTHDLESNVFLRDVQIEVTFSSSGKQQTSKWDFTDSEIRYLDGNEVYRRYFRIPEEIGSAPRIVAGRFTFVKEVRGYSNQMPNRQEKPLNPGVPPTGGRIIGETPSEK